MDPSKIDPRWPNALRWFLCQNLHRFTPWHLIQEPAECDFAARAFAREDVSRGQVFVFAKRQDCDDFAGIEVVEGVLTERVIYFHPVFGSADNEANQTWNIVHGVFDDVFEFVAKQVVPDMKEWASVEDASDL